MAETQGSGTLHMHAVVYISGLPRTLRDFVRRCQDTENGETFRDQFRAFVDSVVQFSLPVSSTPLQQNTNPAYSLASPVDIGGLECPNCEEQHAIKCIPYDEINLKAFTKLPRYGKPVPTSVCTVFKCGFGGYEILRRNVVCFMNHSKGEQMIQNS